MRRRTLTTLGVLLASLALACDDSPTLPTSPSWQSLRGVVRDTLGDAVNGARVEIVDGTWAGRFTLTTSAGEFSIPLDGVSPQPITLRISREGFAPVTRQVFDPSTIVIVMESTATTSLYGDYTMTFAAAASCEGIPSSFRTRTYLAKLRNAGSFNAFTIELGGADLYPGYGTLFGNLGDSRARFWVSSWEAFQSWLEEQPIFEKVGPTSYVSLVGTATSALADPNDLIVAPFDGSIAYCATYQPSSNALWPPVCTVGRAECASTSHRITMVRR